MSAGVNLTASALHSGQLSYVRFTYFKNKNGRDDRIRTCDPLVPSEVRYQAALHPDAIVFYLIFNIERSLVFNLYTARSNSVTDSAYLLSNVTFSHLLVESLLHPDAMNFKTIFYYKVRISNIEFINNNVHSQAILIHQVSTFYE